MYSYEVMLAIEGDATYAERAEKIAYNALPATFAKDMWAHQYIQQVLLQLCSLLYLAMFDASGGACARILVMQPNEINAMHSDPHVWVTDGPDSNIYGLEPNYGMFCCHLRTFCWSW